jgi:hypothetical protein
MNMEERATTCSSKFKVYDGLIVPETPDNGMKQLERHAQVGWLGAWSFDGVRKHRKYILNIIRGRK